MAGVARFEPYQVRPSIAATCRDVDAQSSYLVEVHNENVELRRENTRLRREKAQALQAAEAERVESARLRAQNLELATQLSSTGKEHDYGG